jgi:hypothetical protein
MHSRFKVLRWIVIFLVIGFAVIQFIRPKLSNPPVTAELEVPPQVKQILRTSCYNCHSNETKLSWFDWPVPAFWIVAKDVKTARERLNFSDIGKLPIGQQQAALFEAISQIELGAMPPPDYTRLHPEAAVTPEEIVELKRYLQPTEPGKAAQPAEISSADAEYQLWTQAGSTKPEVAAAPNGIRFMPDYKNWWAISSTERFDNHTIREVLGNDIAVKAIAENRINPWPDGTAFAKVAWLQQLDDIGVVHAGKFYQVEFMVRDSRKYAGTLGWGWARWRGAELKPYGKDSNFAGECVGCHRPLRNTNYVFTAPIRGEQ